MSNLESSFELLTDTNTAGVIFAPPGSTESGARVMCIQPGTFSSSDTSDGNVLMSFEAVHKTDSFEDERQFDTVETIRRIFDEANWVRNGVLQSRVFVRSAVKGEPEPVDSLVVSGRINRVDESGGFNRWNSYRILKYKVEIERLPWAEKSQQTNSWFSKNIHGVTINPDFRFGIGTTSGRVQLLDIQPSLSAFSKFKNIWVGAKPNLPNYTNADRVFYSQVKVDYSSIRVVGRGDNIERVVDTGSIFIGDEGVRVRFEESEDYDESWNWNTRFYVPFLNWNAGGDHTQIPGKYHLLARVQLPPAGSIIGDPRWAIRARLVYGSGTNEYQEIQRTGELYIPAQGANYSQSLTYYDLGPIEIGESFYTMRRGRMDNLSIAVDAALLNIEPHRASMLGSRFDQALYTNYLEFDDFRLVPAESFVSVSLPKLIQDDEKLEIHTDDYGNVAAYVIDRSATGGTATPEYESASPFASIRYKAVNVVTGEYGFTMPSAPGQALVIVADGGGVTQVRNDATFHTVNMAIRPREWGGEI